jgi:ferrochelatase
MIVFTRAEKSQEIYKKIGSKSPLVDITKELVAKLQAKVGDGVIVDFAMRYTPPFADEVVARLNDTKVSDIYLIPLYPQYSTTTTKSSLEDFYESYHKGGGGAIISQIEHFFQNSTYNDAIVQMIKERVASDESAEFDLVFSAHGLPVKVIKKGDPYEKQVNRHVELLSSKLLEAGYKFDNIHLAYQSKVGPMEWLKPSLEDKQG